MDGRAPIRIKKTAFLAALYSFLSNRNEFTKTERDYYMLTGVVNSHAWLNLRAFLYFEFLTGFSYCIHL